MNKFELEFECDKCGKIINYENDPYMTENERWHIDLGRAGYGSQLDYCEIKFNLCDNCLVEFIKTFKNKEKIYNSEI